MSTERIAFEIQVPTVDITPQFFEVRCGETVRYVAHKDRISRLDGPWHYCTDPLRTALAFTTMKEATETAINGARVTERARLIQAKAAALASSPPSTVQSIED